MSHGRKAEELCGRNAHFREGEREEKRNRETALASLFIWPIKRIVCDASQDHLLRGAKFSLSYSANRPQIDLILLFNKSYASRSSKFRTMSTAKTLKKVGIFIGYRVLCYTLQFVSYFASLLFTPKRSALPVIDDHNLVTPALKLSQQIKSGHITSEEVVESFIGRIKRVNPLINAVVDNRFEQALKEAREIDRKLSEVREGSGDKSILDKPLLGVPVSVKETIAVDGQAFTGGLLGRKFVKAPKNADAVNQLIQNGLIPICSTNIPEMAMWWDCSNPVYGKTSNPYDLSCIPGGSSGGEAAVISSAGSVVGIGSDIAGSIRIPSNFCGIFGHKPTPFVVSSEGMYPLVKGDREKLLGVGPMCRYACDLAPMLKVMAGSEAGRLNLDEPVDLKKLKVFYIEDLGDPLAVGCNTDILSGIRGAVSHLADKYKITAERVTFDEFKYGLILWSAEANTEPDAPTMAKQFKDGRAGELNPIVELIKKMFQMSDHNMNSILAATLEKFSPTYGTKGNKMLVARAAELRKKLSDMLGPDGVLLVPTHPEPAPKHHTTLLKIFNVSYTSVTSVLQTPITQCPLGLSKEGLPFGVQVIARPYNDRLTLAVAQELEKAFGGWVAPCRVDV